MIPKVAYFYWAGGPMGWLREQSLVSFQRLHPGWEVRLGSPESRAVPPGVVLVRDTDTDPALPPAARSDLWRWLMLAQHGGVYSDTDVIYVRNLEHLVLGDHEAWLTQDLGTRVPLSGRPGAELQVSIGVCASLPDSLFYRRLAALALREAPSQDYQSHGTSLIARSWAALVGLPGSVPGNLPAAAFYGHAGSSGFQVRQLWRSHGWFSPWDVGVHWYGGSPESRPYLGVGGVRELPDCWVRRALEFVR